MSSSAAAAVRGALSRRKGLSAHSTANASTSSDDEGDGGTGGGGIGGGTLKRAPKQSRKIESSSSDTGGEFNIWYGKRSGRRPDRAPILNRCNVTLDAGVTKGSECRSTSFCLYFARGYCTRGYECSHLHRLPTRADDPGLAEDIFGRDRFGTNRDDMGGVGSFLSTNQRTLYVGGLPASGGAGQASAAAVEARVRASFSEWGVVEYVKLLPLKSCCFVRYALRGSAEFAKEAMADRALDAPAGGGRQVGPSRGGKPSDARKGGKMLNIRWATEDPNPRQQERDKRRRVETMMGAVHEQHFGGAAGGGSGGGAGGASMWIEGGSGGGGSGYTGGAGVPPPPYPMGGGPHGGGYQHQHQQYQQQQRGGWQGEGGQGGGGQVGGSGGGEWGAAHPGSAAMGGHVASHAMNIGEQGHGEAGGGGPEDDPFAYPDTSGQYGSYPDTSAQYPDLATVNVDGGGGLYPDTSGQYPSMSAPPVPVNAAGLVLPSYGQQQQQQQPDHVPSTDSAVVSGGGNALSLLGDYGSSSDDDDGDG